ncbi:MAG: glycosyltransferase family 4 protein [Actinobacteria bacterium]|nr:glycosyltransferase family 4 protein [Actinomycetota bacterium]
MSAPDTRPLKILQVAANTRLGGLPLHVLTLSRALRDRGHEVEILSMDSGPLIARFEQEGFRVATITQLGAKAKRDPLLALKVKREVGRRIEAAAPDIVHSHGPRAHFFSSLAVRGIRGGHEQGRAGCALACSVHGSVSQFTIGNSGSFNGMKSRMRRLQYGGIDRLAQRYSRRMVAVCQATADELINELGIDPAKVVVVRNGIDDRSPGSVPPAELRRSLGFEESDRVAVYVGRLAFHKGAPDFIKAAEIVARELPQARFLVVGDGPMEAELRRQASQGPLAGKAVFTGMREDAVDLVAAADLFVLPSLSEGLPLTLLEAAMLGKAMLATSVGGIPEIVKPGETGELTPLRNPVLLAREMASLLADDAGRGRMGRAARQLWEREFTVEAMTDGMEAVYRELQ